MPTISLFGAATTVNVIIAFAFSLILIYLVSRLILSKVGTMGGYLLRGVGSLAFLIAVNFIGRPLGYGIPINLITVLLPSILGLPGLALVSLLQFLL